MRCTTARASMSARLDGELAPLECDALDAHLAACAGCAAHQARLAALHRALRLQRAPAVPDLTAAILGGLPAGRRRASRLLPALDGARAALGVVAVTQLVLAVPLLVLGQDPGATTHVARELGASNVAIAAGLLAVVWRPQRAGALLPVVAALVVAMVLAGTADVLAGRASLLAESHHLLELLGLALLWLVGRNRPPHERRRGLVPA